MTNPDVPRKGARLGAWSLVLGLFPLVYAGIGVVLGLLGQGRGGNDAAGVTAYVLFFGAFLVFPASYLTSLIFGIIALVRDRALGKVLGAIGLLLVVAAIVALVLFLTGSQSPLNWTDF